MTAKKIIIQQNERGAVINLKITNDKSQMNWVIDPNYLKQMGYNDSDKLFGEFTITIDGKKINSINLIPELININADTCKVKFIMEKVELIQTYQNTDQGLKWHITLCNVTNSKVDIDNLGIWASLAYVMFRDKDIQRNAGFSAAVFPSISPSFTKLAVVRRDNVSPHLGVYQTAGEVLSVGSYSEYCNRFFEDVSPSLDGLLFHQIILAGGYDKGVVPKNDWIYSHKPIRLAANSSFNWEFYLTPFTDKKDFYTVSTMFNHPKISFLPLVLADNQIITFDRNSENNIISVVDLYQEKGTLKSRDLSKQLSNGVISYSVYGLGEHKILAKFKNGQQDMVIFNKMSSIEQLLRERADFISQKSYQGKAGKVPYSFTPISNQGESLGKMNFVLQECLLDSKVMDVAKKIQQVEISAVKYVKPKWFVNGDFKRPRKLYGDGDFYRVMDLEYIAHLFYLLSQCDDQYLKLNSARVYLLWAGEIFNVRINPTLHDNKRGQEEAQMLGQYFLYVENLLNDLKQSGFNRECKEISASWKKITKRIDKNSDKLTAALTEHFFDNAGFGPAAGALALSGNFNGAKKYGELLKANIGFSNDFRSQNPDRWWEALSYMIHALWGGVVSASAVIAGKELADVELIKAGYRGTVALLYMYDSNATTTKRILKIGEAASTYSVAGPNLNRPDLSRNRFGQSIFASGGGIFAKLFPDGYTGEDDWDMGEELVAYLNGLGQETYLYKNKKGVLEVINGKIIQQNHNIVTVKSSAPYPNRYIDLNNKYVFNNTSRQIKFNVSTHCFLT